VRKKKRRCESCGIDITHRHSNAKRCEFCATAKRKRPSHNLTKEQQTIVKELAGKYYVKKIAEIANASSTSVRRFASEKGISLDSLSYKPNVIRKVCKFYEKHGKKKTQEKFPEVRVRSIVERYKEFDPLQIRWTDDQLNFIVKSVSLLSKYTLAHHFRRPGAGRGSITSVYQKRFPFKMKNLNGLSAEMAAWFIKKDVFGYKTDIKTGAGRPTYRVLWVDIEKNMRDDLPPHIKKGIRAMARFQKWLHGNNVHKSVEEILSI
jgi:hypothetical protein